MSVTKISAVGKPDVLLAHGAHDTKIGNEDRQYDGISLAAIAAMVADPQAKEKSDASFIIPSTYRAHDGRKHAAQREHGEFHYLAIDIDEGSPSLVELKDAVRRVTGDATVLIYSSSGASEDNRKWRVLIPLLNPISGVDYGDTQLALFQLMGEQGVRCDAALARVGQPIYLPNIPPAKRDQHGQPLFYHQDRHRGEGYFDVENSSVWGEVRLRRQRAAIAESKAMREREQRLAERIKRREASGDDLDPVAEFNSRYTVDDMLLRCGYTRDGNSQSYASRYQSSGSFATKNFGEYWVSLSGSDVGAGIGAVKGDYCWGDAFDLFCHYEHNGDMKVAVREYGRELRPANDYTAQREEIMREAMAAKADNLDDLDDFDIIPDAAPQQGGIITPNAPRAPIFWARDAMPMLRSAYLVKGWLGSGQMSVVYGPSNVGKSFFCLDMAFTVAAKMDWQGCKTRGGPVLYLATEGGNAFHNRVIALRKQYGIDDVQLAVRPSPVNLLDPAADLAGLLELCAEIERTCGAQPCMIVVDTLSRALAGGDENGSVDMTSFIANCDALRDASGAHIMIVHHSGKDTAKGARGHSSLRAATDTEIELAVNGTMRTATATKQRDLEPQPPFMFSLKVHTLGHDEDGDDVTTCTITKASDEDAADVAQKRPTGANQKIITKAFKQLRGEGRGYSSPVGAGFPESGDYWCIPADQLRDFSEGKMTSTNPRSAYTQALEALFAMGYMVQNEGLIWIAAKEGRTSK